MEAIRNAYEKVKTIMLALILLVCYLLAIIVFEFASFIVKIFNPKKVTSGRRYYD